MAHPQQQYPPRAYSPSRSIPSPHPGNYGPPTKRQRLSPNPPSPYASPGIANGSLPDQTFSNPYYGVQPNGQQLRHYVEPSQPPPSAGTMGPPSRPVDKPTDVNDLSDVLAGSGVDLKEEEAALFNRYNNTNQRQNGTSFSSDHSTLLGLSVAGGNQEGAYSPYGTFNTLLSNVPGDRGSFYGAGTFNQPAIPAKTLEEQVEERRKRAMQWRAERRQYHLNESFLQSGIIEHKIIKQAHSTQVKVPHTGLLVAKQGVELQMLVAGPDENEVLTKISGQDLLYRDAPLVEILTLMSLATQERLRGIVADTATLAKGRRVGTHGVVDTEFSDLAVGSGTADPALLPTPGNSAVSPKSNPLKRSFSDLSKFPAPISDRATTANTIAFPNQTLEVLRRSSTLERALEEERAAKRSKRTVNGLLSGDVSRPGSVPSASIGAGIPGAVGERAPDVDVKKGNKKDQKRQADAKATEAQQHAATNRTMNMQLGGGKKKPSWMTSAKDTPSTGGFVVQSRFSAASQSLVRASNGAGSNGAGGMSHNKTQFGEFREDHEGGAGIQMRDVVLVLDPQLKEKKTLARAYVKLNSSLRETRH